MYSFLKAFLVLINPLKLFRNSFVVKKNKVFQRFPAKLL